MSAQKKEIYQLIMIQEPITEHHSVVEECQAVETDDRIIVMHEHLNRIYS